MRYYFGPCTAFISVSTSIDFSHSFSPRSPAYCPVSYFHWTYLQYFTYIFIVLLCQRAFYTPVDGSCGDIIKKSYILADIGDLGIDVLNPISYILRDMGDIGFRILYPIPYIQMDIAICGNILNPISYILYPARYRIKRILYPISYILQDIENPIS